MSVYKDFLKRGLDFLISFIGMIILSPLMLIITASLYFNNQGSPFFFQVRPGKNGRLFRVVKFKTMTDQRDEKGKLLPDAERLTPLGKIIRATSVDELPQLMNVLKGDMSLVGPRPLLVDYLPLYNQEQARRHDVRPGITGWAQVNGRNAISWEQKFAYDVWYVDHLSFALDVKIILMTIAKVLKREGISQQGNATMERFTGNRTV